MEPRDHLHINQNRMRGVVVRAGLHLVAAYVRPIQTDHSGSSRATNEPQPRTTVILCVPITSSTSCHQAIFVDQAADPSLSSDAVQVEIDRLG
jgi:hypothetical protein